MDKLATYTKIKTPEKAYLQTDKDIYTHGETIYLMNRVTHSYSSKSHVIYVNLIDWKGNVDLQQKLFVEAEGAPGAIKISEDIKEGAYFLRVHT